MSGMRVAINGIDLYYEVHGTGRPLVVLHGGVLNAETCFGAMIPRLAAAHQVIAVDSIHRDHLRLLDPQATGHPRSPRPHREGKPRARGPTIARTGR